MWKSESEVAQSSLTLCDPMDCSLSGSSVHEIFQARVLEWVAISFSRRSSRPRDWTQVSSIVGSRFTVWTTREVFFRVPASISRRWEQKDKQSLYNWNFEMIIIMRWLWMYPMLTALNPSHEAPSIPLPLALSLSLSPAKVQWMFPPTFSKTFLVFMLKNYISRSSFLSPQQTKMFGHLTLEINIYFLFSSVTQLCLSLRSHGLQHTRFPCPSSIPRACSNSCPSSWWCHPTISLSIVPSPPVFNLSQHQGLFQWVNFSHQVAILLEFQRQHQSVLPMTIQDWFPLGFTCWISLQSKEFT